MRVITVNTLDDVVANDGMMSLREAVRIANNGGETLIRFAKTLSVAPGIDQTLTLDPAS